ncbi:MAG: hypothetical protein AB7V42_07465 [Thermoleophilia bacterium]
MSEAPLIPRPARRRSGEEPVAGAYLADFWRWAYSDLLGNTGRGVFAEWIVGRALGCVDGVREGWANHDLEWDAIRIEVKSAAYLQAWQTRTPSRIVFGGLRARAWDPVTGEWAAVQTYRADVYVFCILTATDHDRIDPLDTNQWQFWVVGQEAVSATGLRSIGLALVQRLAGDPVLFAGLPGAVRRATGRTG